MCANGGLPSKLAIEVVEFDLDKVHETQFPQFFSQKFFSRFYHVHFEIEENPTIKKMSV